LCNTDGDIGLLLDRAGALVRRALLEHCAAATSADGMAKRRGRRSVAFGRRGPPRIRDGFGLKTGKSGRQRSSGRRVPNGTLPFPKTRKVHHRRT